MDARPLQAAFDQHDHDHRDCINAALAAAQDICARDRAQLTQTRRRVLELIWAHRRPVGAYEVLEALSAERGRVAPPTVYRALDFLQAHGLVHRLASQSRFVACDHPENGGHGGVFLVCDRCGQAVEWQDERVARAVARSAREAGFRLGAEVLPEVEGTCGDCWGD